MPVLLSNNAASTLSASISNVATSFSVASGHGAKFPAPGGSDYFYVTLIDSASNLEIVKVTARSADTFTVIRAQDGTTARAFSAGDRVEARLTKAVLDDFKTDTRFGYAPLTGIGTSGTWPISITGSAASITGTYGGSLNSSQITTALGYTPYNAGANTVLTNNNYGSYSSFSGVVSSPGSQITDITAAKFGNYTTIQENGFYDASANFLHNAIKTSGVDDNWVFRNAGTATRYRMIGGNHSWQTASSGAIGTAVSFVERMSLNTQGNLAVAGTLNTGGAITQNGSQVLTAGNYTSYSPSLTGSGASGSWGISVSGNAATATTLQTGRTIALTGDVTYTSGSFNGSANVTGTATLAASGVTAGTYSKVTVDAKGRVTTGAALASADLPTYTGTLTSTQITTGLGYTPYDPGANIVLTNNNYSTYGGPFKNGSGAFGTWGISVSGNAATATTLQTARTINGVSFNGSADITVADVTKLSLGGGSLTGNLGIGSDVTSALSTIHIGTSNPEIRWDDTDAAGVVQLRQTGGTFLLTVDPTNVDASSNFLVRIDNADRFAVTPAGASVTGNLTFTAASSRIIGDFSNVTLGSRTLFQTSTANSGTSVASIPNGSPGTAQSNYCIFAGADTTNSSFVLMGINNSTAIVTSNKIGSATAVPLHLTAGSGTNGIVLETGGNIFVGDTVFSTGSIELGTKGNGDRSAIIDFHASGAPLGVDFSARIHRYPGVNGGWIFDQVGSGWISFYHGGSEKLYVSGSRVGLPNGSASRGVSGYPITTPNDSVANALRAGGYIEWSTDVGAIGTNYFNSDARLKKNIAPTVKTARQAIDQIEFKQFDWNEFTDQNNEHVELGVIAQQLQQVNTKFVNEMSDSTLGVNEPELLTYALKAIQELSAELSAVRQELIQLQGAA